MSRTTNLKKIDKLTSACIVTDILIAIVNIIEAITAYKNNNILFCIAHSILATALIYTVHIIKKK